MSMYRSDILYLLIGGNPMPNLMSIGTRLKKEGKVICLYTNYTEKIYRKIQFILREKEKCGLIKMKVEGIYLKEVSNLAEVKKELNKRIEVTRNKSLINELNFTGATTPIATFSFQILKKKAKEEDVHTIFSYFDSERSKLNLMILNSNNEDTIEEISYGELEDYLKLDANDIRIIHDDKIKLVTENIYKNMQFPKLRKKILEEVLISKDHAVDFTNALYYSAHKIYMDKYKKAKKEKEEIILEKDKKKVINNILSNGKWKNFKEEKDFFIDLKKNEVIRTMKFRDFLSMIMGFWLEGYITEIALELKKEGIINEIFTSVIREKNIGADFEVDLVIHSNYGLKSISITTVEDYNIAKYKLYEIKIRARQIGGDESQIAYINFSDKNTLERAYKNYWNNSLSKDLIIGYSELNNVRELMRAWIIGGNEFEYNSFSYRA